MASAVHKCAAKDFAESLLLLAFVAALGFVPINAVTKRTNAWTRAKLPVEKSAGDKGGGISTAAALTRK